MKTIGLLVLALSLASCVSAEDTTPPVATATIVDDFECHVESKSRLRADVCGGFDSEVFITYSELDTETFERLTAVAMGPIDEIGHAVLHPVTVTGTEGSWHGHSFIIRIKRDETEEVLFFNPPGQPDVFGEFVLPMQTVPPGVLKLVPEDGTAGYYGIIPSTGERFFVYSTPSPKDTGEEDEIGRMISALYPSLENMHVLMGGSSLKPVEVTETYSYGGGAHVYIETSRGVFFFPSRGRPPIFGAIAYRHYLPE